VLSKVGGERKEAGRFLRLLTFPLSRRGDMVEVDNRLGLPFYSRTVPWERINSTKRFGLAAPTVSLAQELAARRQRASRSTGRRYHLDCRGVAAAQSAY
jgi:hypothetical protein